VVPTLRIERFRPTTAKPDNSVDPPTLPANVTVISAAAAGQISRTDLKKGYGLFTYYFLKSWKANGADFRTAFESAKSEVEQVARSEYGSDQSPQWRRGR
jgi:hypothetical protein